MNLFNRRRTSGRAGSIKTWVGEELGLNDSDLVTVAELVCNEPDCPPIETLISVHKADGSRRDWRIHKPLAEMTQTDVLKHIIDGVRTE
ncbi:MAG: hypothetical protein CBB68_12710 [Rhodospirillaceae bacterium TMED8]|mgnify:FL=1|nr:hypothetical protein [Magnetovibrio sp.]OUT48970.1 MAG: hypothetical protein CBB68_12710 [Rhodospirillaceae bacterium TMED8]|tara:strand:- start:613 stop:879 length:267 start_codon:yes stop_codon:yes gene_type:complete